MPHTFPPVNWSWENSECDVCTGPGRTVSECDVCTGPGRTVSECYVFTGPGRTVSVTCVLVLGEQ